MEKDLLIVISTQGYVLLEIFTMHADFLFAFLDHVKFVQILVQNFVST